MQTPILYGDILYVCRDNGVLSAFDAKTGQRHYQARLGNGSTGFSASAVAAAGRIYFTSEDGDVYVVKAGPAFELLATNSLGEVAMATPAISENALIFRTRGHLLRSASRGLLPYYLASFSFPLALHFSLFTFSFLCHSSLSPSNHAIGPSAA